MSVGNLVRVAAVLVACAAAAGSATSSSSSGSNQNPSLAASGQNGAPPPQQMEPNLALGLWRSTFGAVKIEADNSHGGLAAGSVQGIWMYQRQGQEIVGYFAGNLRGNVLSFRWQEPNNPPLTGEGYLVFDVQGRQYSGRWWSEKRDRVGDWNGWRPPMARGGRPYPGEAGGAYGGQDYGYDPYRRQQPYPPRPYQPSPYQQQPYQQQPYQQPYPPSPYQQPPSQNPYQQPPYQQPSNQRQPPPQPPPSQPTYY